MCLAFGAVYDEQFMELSFGSFCLLLATNTGVGKYPVAASSQKQYSATSSSVFGGKSEFSTLSNFGGSPCCSMMISSNNITFLPCTQSWIFSWQFSVKKDVFQRF
jgi:hypothetical protein